MTKRQTFKKILFSALITVIFFSSLEILARLAYWVKYRDKGYAFYGATNLELSFARYLNSFRPATAKKGLNIVVVGGSTVWCEGLPRGLDWPAQLERLFHENGRGDVAVVNLGENGSDSTTDLIRLRNHLRTNNPAIVIFSNGINDSVALLVDKTGRPYLPPGSAHARFLERLNALLSKRSLFYAVVRERTIVTLSKLHETRDDLKKKYTTAASRELTIKTFTANLLDVIDVAKRLEIKLVLSFPPYYKTRYRFCDELRQVMADIARRNGVPYLDVADKFDSLEEKKMLFLPDEVHVNGRGAAREAEFVHGYLKEQLKNLLTN